MGFERTFCDNAISEILGNKHIVDVPPDFWRCTLPPLVSPFLFNRRRLVENFNRTQVSKQELTITPEWLLLL